MKSRVKPVRFNVSYLFNDFFLYTFLLHLLIRFGYKKWNCFLQNDAKYIVCRWYFSALDLLSFVWINANKVTNTLWDISKNERNKKRSFAWFGTRAWAILCKFDAVWAMHLSLVSCLVIIWLPTCIFPFMSFAFQISGISCSTSVSNHVMVCSVGHCIKSSIQCYQPHEISIVVMNSTKILVFFFLNSKICIFWSVILKSQRILFRVEFFINTMRDPILTPLFSV